MPGTIAGTGTDLWRERRQSSIQYDSFGDAWRERVLNVESTSKRPTALTSASKAPCFQSAGTPFDSQVWIDYLFAEKPIQPGHWKYDVD